MYISDDNLNELAKMLLVTTEELRSKSRKGRLVTARKVLAIYLVKRKFGVRLFKNGIHENFRFIR